MARGLQDYAGSAALIRTAWKNAYVKGFKDGVAAGEKMRTEAFKMFGRALGEKLGQEEAEGLMLAVAKKMDEIVEQERIDRKAKP